MKKLRKLLLPLCSIFLIAPVFLTTSCIPTYKQSLYEVKFKKDSISKSLKECSKPKKSLQELICGTRNFHFGNYMLILGSECSEKSNEFFSPDPLCSKTHYDYAKNEAFVNSMFYNSINSWLEYYNDPNIDFGLILYIDIESLKTANKDLMRRNMGQYREFDEKWSSSDVKEAEDRKINTSKKKVVIEDKFKRKDKSASTMRNLLEYLQTIFSSDSFPFEESRDLPCGLVWKEGVPQKEYFKKITRDSTKNYFDNVLALWKETK